MRSVLKDEMDLILFMWKREIQKLGFYQVVTGSTYELKKDFTLSYAELTKILNAINENKKLSKSELSYANLRLRRLIAAWQDQGYFEVSGGLYYSENDKNHSFPLFVDKNFELVPTNKTIKSLQAKTIKIFIDNYNKKINEKGSIEFITNLKDLSLEHYCPLCRVSYDIAKQYDNIFPAIKVINHLKSGLLPCEWHAQRQDLLSQAIRKAHNNRDRKIFIDALQNTNFYKINPCTYCVLYETCNLSAKSY